MNRKSTYLLLPLLALILGCVKNKDFEPLSTNCNSELTANATFAELKSLYQGELLQIQDDLIIEGYIISSDKSGNFFSALYFQNESTNPTEGLQIEIDLFESHLFFPLGQKILIKTKGLFLGKSKGVFKLGGTFSGFGNTTVGRLPALKINEHIFRSCDEPALLTPKPLSIDIVDSSATSQLVTFEGLQFMVDDFGKTFAEPEEETERILEDCNGNTLTLLNSGFADFQSEIIYEERGNITGVLVQENNDFFLVIRNLGDLEFSQERCADPRETSNAVFFSELADPNNNSSARFIELYNASSQPINLTGWTINRYTNANTEISSTIELTGQRIESESTLVISPNSEEFERVYGFLPDLTVGTNSPADSNGDDNLELVDPFGTVIDVFGVPGEDGTGTNHEFEDGRAFRIESVLQANPIYTFEEWTIYNDSGGSGTVNQPQNAPEDFTPGSRN